jgi:hypothetical protein
MGLYVVARLARRHNIRVKLRANEDIDGGTVALIVIPEDLVHRPGEEQHSPLGTADNLVPANQAGMIDTFPPPGPMPAEPDLAGAASAAAGIAGAFGLASGRSRDDATGVGHGSNGSGRTGTGARIAPVPAESELEPATSFWASDFEPSGKLDASELEDDPGPQTQTIAGNSASLWEAHTAADNISADEQAWQPQTTGSGNGSGTPSGSGNGAGNGAARPEVDAPTERLPIYEAVLSQWFRADEVQDSQQHAQDAPPAAAQAEAAQPQAPAAAPEAPEAPEPPAAPADPNRLLPTRVPGRAGAALGFGTAPRQSGNGSDNGNGKAASTSGGNGFAAAAASNGGDSNGTSTWQSPADEGWQRAEALLAPVSEKTTAGLPKRVPKAHLVPGSAAPRAESSGSSQGSGGGTTAATLAPPALPPRTADAVRGRMSSFQQGIRRGRHTMTEAYSGEASQPSAHRADEEQE